MPIRFFLHRFSVLFGLLLSLICFPVLAQSPPGNIVFSELMWLYGMRSDTITIGYVYFTSFVSNKCLTNGSKEADLPPWNVSQFQS